LDCLKRLGRAGSTRRVNCNTRSMLGSKFGFRKSCGCSMTGTLLTGDGLTTLAATCQTYFSSTTLRKWDSAIPILSQDMWTPTPAISSPFRMQHAQSTPWTWVPAVLTLLRTSPTLQTQPKALRRACGRHCRVSWVLSRSTLPMESTLPRRATEATMDRCSTSEWKSISVAFDQESFLTKADTSLRKTS
jgi:hypothetical protein